MKGKLKNGFEYTVSDKLDDDYELLELLKTANEDATAYVKVIERIFGEAQAKELKEALRDKDGIVSTKAMADAVVEVIEQVAKN